MRIFRVFLLALLVVSAGCAGYLSETDSTVEAHESSLYGANYRVRASVTANTSEIGGFWAKTNRWAHVGTGIAVIRGRENGTSVRAYRTDRVRCVGRTERCPSIVLSSLGRANPPRVNERLAAFFTRVDFIVSGTVVRNGTKYVRLEATEATIPNTKQFSATALVTSDGHVRELTGSSVVNADGMSDRATKIDFAYEFRRAASPPVHTKWARNVPRLLLHRVADGEGIAIHNTGHIAVPAGTSFSIKATNRNVTDGEPVFCGIARLGQPLQPGETQYLHASRVSGKSDSSLPT